MGANVPELPDTTSTFLVADIPESTVAWGSNPAVVADGARFATALHAAAEANGSRLHAEAGRWAITFDTPGAALAAALDVIGTLQANAAARVGRIALYAGRMEHEVLAAGLVPARALVLL